MHNLKCLACALLAGALLIGVGQRAAAEPVATPEPQNTVDYWVRAILPSNQVDEKATVFDLLVTPGQRQELQVTVVNRADDEIEVTLEAGTAFTNENGVMVYEVEGEPDESMAVRFAKIVTPVEPVIKVPARGTATARFLVEAPEEPFEGAVYGGLVFTKANQTNDEGGGVGIRNIYRYVVVARLRENLDPIEYEFELTGAKAERDVRRPALVLNLRNPVARIARGITVRAKVFAQPGESQGDGSTGNEPGNQAGEVPLFTIEAKNVDMAPNTAMAYKMRSGEVKKLGAGTYRVAVELELKDQVWSFRTPLVVD